MLARADGKEFEVDPVVFRVEDQAYIKEWMKSVPEKKQYRFTVNGTKTKVGGDFTDMGYKRIKNEQWAYKLAITNSSSDPVTGISIRYRLFYTNRADGEFSAGSDRGVYMKPGQAPIPGELVSNQTIEITTDAVKLDFVDYDGTRDRYKDELEGCIVQVLNADGQVLHEWSNTASPMKGRTWDNTGKLTQQISP
jgi:hypothetical protein